MPAKTWTICGVPCLVLEHGTAEAMSGYLPPGIAQEPPALHGLGYGLAVHPGTGDIFLAVRVVGRTAASVSNFGADGLAVQRSLLALATPPARADAARGPRAGQT